MTTIAELVGTARLAEARILGDGATPVADVTLDSRAVIPGSVFCCVRGAHLDGHQFAARAVSAGATALVVDHDLELDGGVAQVVVPDVRAVVGPLACAVHGFPARQVTMVGVTGTNGKTTVTAMITAVLREAGHTVGVIGTLTGAHTTPEAPELQRLLADWVRQGTDTVVMEVSSHALALHRVDGIQFDVAVFTNLGRDHLDLHGTVEQYFAAKAALFEPQRSRRGVINGDDAYGARLVDTALIPVEVVRRSDLAEVRSYIDHVTFRWRGVKVRVPIGGSFNVDNAHAACVAARALGCTDTQIADGLAAMAPVPGRFERVAAGQPFEVVVDFAHTPDGLDAALATVRDSIATGRVIVVFGAGGDRDKDKRPLMGAAAARGADVIVVTSDNPRSEAPEAIIADILGGVPDDFRGEVVVEADRRVAFGAAFRVALPGDVVVIAGKGHERTQTAGNMVYEFDDRAVARQELEAAK